MVCFQFNYGDSPCLSLHLTFFCTLAAIIRVAFTFFEFWRMSWVSLYFFRVNAYLLVLSNLLLFLGLSNIFFFRICISPAVYILDFYAMLFCLDFQCIIKLKIDLNYYLRSNILRMAHRINQPISKIILSDFVKKFFINCHS